MPNGTLDQNGDLRQGQWNVYSMFRQAPICGGLYAAPAALSTTATDVRATADAAEQTAAMQDKAARGATVAGMSAPSQPAGRAE